MTAMLGRCNGGKMNSNVGTNLHSTSELAEIEAFIRAGAKRFFDLYSGSFQSLVAVRVTRPRFLQEPMSTFLVVH
jgi:hypothetical protein